MAPAPNRSGTALRWLSVAALVAGWMVLGYQLAHAIAYDLAGPWLEAAGTGDVGAHSSHQHAGMHAYFGRLRVAGQLVLGAGVVALLLAIVVRGRAVEAFARQVRWLERRSVRTVFGLAPSAVFIAAEFIERWTVGASAPPPLTLLVCGVLVQVCVGMLVAWVVSRSLRIVHVILRVLDHQPHRADRSALRIRSGHECHRRTTRPMASRRAGRAPPAFGIR